MSAALAVVGLITLTVVVTTSDNAPPDPDSQARRTRTIEIVARTLSRDHHYDGQLDFADTRTVSSASSGTVTRLTPAGTIVEPGDALYAVNEVPTWLLHGATPAWRTMEDGIDDGADVRQLEENLIALGFGDTLPDADSHWDWRTRAAVREWQSARGVPTDQRDGRVRTSEIRFEPGAVRVQSHESMLGDQVDPGTPILGVAANRPQVNFEVDASSTLEFTIGAAVEVVLPDGTTSTGSVSAIDTRVRPPDHDSDRGATIAVTVEFDEPTAIGEVTSGPVDVTYTAEERHDALAAPVEALIALPDGGYAVERATSAGIERLAVDLGMFDDGWVEVTNGAIDIGDELVVPA